MASIDYTKCLPRPAADMIPNGSATFADLERIDQHNGLVNFHLKAWRQGAFLSVERMLTSLAVHLAATNEALTERAVERLQKTPSTPFAASAEPGSLVTASWDSKPRDIKADLRKVAEAAKAMGYSIAPTEEDQPHVVPGNT